MDKTKAIVASCIFIGLAVMGQTGYTIYHNRVVAEHEQQQREIVAKQAAEALKSARSKAAWSAAVKHLPVQLSIWFLVEQVSPAPSRHKAAGIALLKYPPVGRRHAPPKKFFSTPQLD